MPLDLSGAIPQPRVQFTTTKVKSDYGVHDGYWIGMGEPFKEKAFEPCKRCKGQRVDRNGNQCQACEGTGSRVDTKVALYYDLENGNREEEIVNFALTPPSQGQDGKVYSASTMFLRFRTFSGLKDPIEISHWASTLPANPRVPVQLVIEDNKNGTALKIGQVLRRNPSAQQPVEHRPEPADNGFNEDDWAGLERR